MPLRSALPPPLPMMTYSQIWFFSVIWAARYRTKTSRAIHHLSAYSSGEGGGGRSIYLSASEWVCGAVRWRRRARRDRKKAIREICFLVTHPQQQQQQQQQRTSKRGARNKLFTASLTQNEAEYIRPNGQHVITVSTHCCSYTTYILPCSSLSVVRLTATDVSYSNLPPPGRCGRSRVYKRLL